MIGLLDVPDFFLDPSRMKASLLWFWRGHVEYKFPNNARVLNAEVEAIEFTDGAFIRSAGHQRRLAVRHQHLGQ